MRRTAIVTLLAAGLVATGAGPSLAGKPAPKAPDFTVHISNVSYAEYDSCDINFRAAFPTAPAVLPTGWKYAGEFDVPVTRLGRYVGGVFDDGSSPSLTFLARPGQTVYVAFAPVYGKKTGPTVTAQATCVL